MRGLVGHEWHRPSPANIRQLWRVIGSDRLSKPAIDLLADGTVSAVDAVLETHDARVPVRFRLDRDGRVVRSTADTAGLEMTSRKRPFSKPISYFVGGGALKRVKLAACIFQEPPSRFSTWSQAPWISVLAPSFPGIVTVYGPAAHAMFLPTCTRSIV